MDRLNGSISSNFGLDHELLQPSQYFIKLEIIPIPNQKTMVGIYNKCKYGGVYIFLLEILTLVSFFLIPQDSPAIGSNWLIAQFVIGFIYLSLILNNGKQLIQYEKSVMDNLDRSTQFIKICKVWITYLFVYILEIVCYTWSIYGVIILRTYGNQFKNCNVIVGFMITIAVLEFVYCLLIYIFRSLL